MEFPSDWNEFVSLLLRHRVKFLLIGAHALGAHGIPRATLDLDVFVEPSDSNARRIAAALDDFGFSAYGEAAAALGTPDRMLRLGREPYRIDILNEISGVSWASAWKHRVRARVGDHRVHVIGLSEFKRNKRASGRTKDLLDLALLDEATIPAASRSRRTRPRRGAAKNRTPGTRRR